jgi:hypothetical protein
VRTAKAITALLAAGLGLYLKGWRAGRRNRELLDAIGRVSEARLRSDAEVARILAGR